MEFEKKMPGYTGYKPQFINEKPNSNESAVIRDNRFYIPGKYIYIKLILFFEC